MENRRCEQLEVFVIDEDCIIRGLMTIANGWTCFLIAAALMFGAGCAGWGGRMENADDLASSPSMPDVMVMNDGTRVTTPAQWQQRRAEMKAVLEHDLLGAAPPPPGNLVASELDHRTLRHGRVDYWRVKLTFGSDHQLALEAAIFVPTKGAGPFATIVMPWFYPTPGSAVVPTTLPATERRRRSPKRQPIGKTRRKNPSRRTRRGTPSRRRWIADMR